MDYEAILYEVKGTTAVITLNRPEALNSLSPTEEGEMHEALDVADNDDKVRAIILTGAGRAFSSGYDLSGRNPSDGTSAPSSGKYPRTARAKHPDPTGYVIKDWWKNDLGSIQKLMHLAYLSKPVIAAVNGWCMGGGFWYACVSDITIASDQAVFAQPEVRMTSNVTYLFVHLCGWKVASRYALTGDHIDANEAFRIGLVNEVVPHDQLMEKAMALANRIALVPEPAVRFAKAVTFMGLEAAGLRAGMVVNAGLSAMAHSSWMPEYMEELDAAAAAGGLRQFLKVRDDKFRPEPFGPRSIGKAEFNSR